MITITPWHHEGCERKHLKVTCPHGEIFACLPRAPKKGERREAYHEPKNQEAEMAARLREKNGCTCQVVDQVRTREGAA
ncbi:MAG: hypothetical protein AB7R89_06045 [Dehalococcoidia bacterium]